LIWFNQTITNKKTQEGKALKFNNENYTFIIIVLIVLLVWYGGWQLIDHNIVISKPDKDALQVSSEELRGVFGDKFGAINALFSGLAFAGIIWTILLQRKELIASRDSVSNQRFDNTFFQLLKMHISITEKLTFRSQNGVTAFSAFIEHLKFSDTEFPVFSALRKIDREDIRKIIDSKNVNVANLSQLSDSEVQNLNVSLENGTKAYENYLDDNYAMHKKKIVVSYTNTCAQYIDYFSHYYRHLYQILKFIDDSKLISNEDKVRYTKFLRAQLSEPELISLFYNCLTKIELPSRNDIELGFPKMSKLIIKYDILQNMNPLSIFHPVHQIVFDIENKVS